MSDSAPQGMDGGFGKYVPGFEFLQSLVGQGSGSAPPLSSLGNWVAPTFNVEDLEKRIAELKAVQFWLDQNAKALAATIQALEVQKMTLSTLQTMNLSMGDVAQSLGAMVGLGAQEQPAQAPAPRSFAGLEIPPRTYGNPSARAGSSADTTDDTADDEASQADEASADAAQPANDGAQAGASAVVDPMQWWGALTQQFQQIASNAMEDVSRQMTPAAAPAPRQRSTRQATAPKAPAKKAPARQAAASTRAKATKPRKPAAASPATAAGEWPMPTAFFQMPGFPGVSEPAAKKKAPAKATTKTSRARATSASTRPPAAQKTPAKKAPAKKAAAAGRRR